MIQHSLDSLKSSQQFITLVVDDKNKRIRFFAWNILNYHAYDTDIPKGMVNNFIIEVYKYIVKGPEGSYNYTLFIYRIQP